MKKAFVLTVVFAVSLLASGMASAAPYGAAGCGLGGVVVGEQPGAMQLVATFLNSLCANQTFGITTGTLGCGKPIVGAQNEQLNQFVAANMDTIARDIARGGGETLETLAELMQIPVDGRTAFYGKLQSNFDRIFTSGDVVMANVVDNIVTVSAN